jgi:hypothetical protein
MLDPGIGFGPAMIETMTRLCIAISDPLSNHTQNIDANVAPPCILHVRANG